VIAAQSLTRRFGKRTVVNDVSFEVGRGEILALLGPNGAGKTTTLRMLAGLIAPTSGSIAIDGVRLGRATGGLLRSRIGFLTESPGLWDRLTVSENLRVYAELYGLERPDHVVQGALEVFTLADHATARAAELSKGMRQKVALARALVHNPAILLLDEPTSGLDPIGAGDFDELVRTLQRTLGLTVFMVTHDLDSLYTACDRIAVLGNGKIIAAGSIADMQASQHPWLRQYFHGKRARAVMG
jgi:phospholipid/cholesterol/gamma-HCH transport system ATP-binding protein